MAKGYFHSLEIDSVDYREMERRIKRKIEKDILGNQYPDVPEVTIDFKASKVIDVEFNSKET